MSPLLTTYANGSARGYGAFSVAAAAGDFESIATVTVGSGGSSTVEFTNIPSTYTHLQVRAITRSTRNDPFGFYTLRFNGSATTYQQHYIAGDGASVLTSSGGYTDIWTAGGTSLPSAFGAAVFDILDYANTNKNKTTKCLFGDDRNGLYNNFPGRISFWSQGFFSTNAITSIQFADAYANFAQYSHFALYGIKSA